MPTCTSRTAMDTMQVDLTSGRAFQNGACRAYEAPSEDQLEALQVLVRYLYVQDSEDRRAPRKPALASSFQWLPESVVCVPDLPRTPRRCV